MISELVDFFPFNIESGPDFLLFYFALTVIGLIGAWSVRNLVQASIDAKSARAPSDAIAPESSYRSPSPSSPRRRLTVGWVPWADEVWAIAFLRNGRGGVASTMIATAVSAGWLVQRDSVTLAFVKTGAPSDPIFAAFYRELEERGGGDIPTREVFARARLVANQQEPTIVRDLETAGLLSTARARSRARLITWLVGLGVLGVGIVRSARAVELERPFGFLIVEMVFALIAFAILAAVVRKRTASGKAYLRWLGDATGSLRADLLSGRRRDPAEVALGVATVGIVGMAAVPVLAPLIVGHGNPQLFDHGFYPSTSSSSSSCSSSSSSCSSSSSSCSSSSSSCGGGGGCGGGSSCGGGGGCGG